MLTITQTHIHIHTQACIFAACVAVANLVTCVCEYANKQLASSLCASLNVEEPVKAVRLH